MYVASYSRERNRIHAKKSRYRRKLLHEDLVSTVEFLNTETSRMKEVCSLHVPPPEKSSEYNELTPFQWHVDRAAIESALLSLWYQGS